MSLFLSGCPLWLGSLLLVILPTLAAMSGPILIRRRIGLEHLTTNNDIAGFKFATVGVIYAVMLAFAVIIVWQRFSDAETTVVKEAGAAATLYRLAAGPDPEGSAMRSASITTCSSRSRATGRGWPRRRKRRGHRWLSMSSMHACSRWRPAALRQQAVLVEMFNQLDDITQARRSRLHLATGIMPGMLWAVLTRRDPDGRLHLLLRHSNLRAQYHDRDLVGHRVYGPVCDRVDRRPIHRTGAHRQPAAAKRRRRRLRSRLNGVHTVYTALFDAYAGQARPLGPHGVNQAVTAVTVYRFTICRPGD